jgi:hypothetical protein
MNLSDRFEIVKLEERIAPVGVPCPIPANDNALPQNNEGTANAAGHILDGPEQAAVAIRNWFGKAAC